MNKATELDQVTAAHDAYLAEIEHKALLGPGASQLLGGLKRLFSLVFRFEAYTLQVFPAKDAAKGEIVGPRVSPAAKAELVALADAFDAAFESLLDMLSVHSDDSLRGLAFRLDFSEYYAARKAAAATTL